MGIVIRQSIKSSIISYIGVGIGTFNVLYLYPKFLLPEQIGLIKLLQDFPILFATFFQLGAANLTERFYSYFSSEGKKDAGLPFVAFTLPLIGFLLFLIGNIFFYDKISHVYAQSSPLFSSFFFLIIPLTLIQMYIGVLEAYARINFRIVIPALVREILLRVLFSLIIFSYALQWINLDILIYLFVGTYFIALIALFVYINKLKQISYLPNFKLFSKPIVKEMISFVLFLLPGIGGSMLASKIDTVMLGYLTNLNDTGIYSLAYFIGSVVETPKRALSQISIPVIARAWKDNNMEEIKMIYKKSSLNLLIAGGIIFLLIWINIDEFFLIMPNGSRYTGGIWVVFFIGLSRVFDMATGVNGELILYSKWYKVNIVMVLLLAIITISLNYVFIPGYGIEGAAFAALIAIIIFNIAKSVFLYFKAGIHPFHSNLFIVIGLVIVLSFGATLLPVFTGNLFTQLITIAYKSTLTLTVFLGIIYYFRISPELNQLFMTFLTRLSKFNNHNK